MKFSIIIPVYNVEKYLEECLNSILNQEYSDYEIICIDDASTDNSYKILCEYEKKYEKIKIINNEINSGLSYTRNKGLRIAKGEYIWFIDSDDYIEENALNIISDSLAENPVDILNFNYILKIDKMLAEEKNNVWKSKYQKLPSIQTGQVWFCESMKNHTLLASAWSKVFRKEFLIENNLFFYENLLHEDILFFIQAIILAKKVNNLSNYIYIYRRRKNSITTTVSKKIRDSFVVIVNEILAIWKTEKLEEGMDEAIKAYILEKCIPILKKNIKYYPDEKKLEIGKKEDQFFFELMCMLSAPINYRYVNLNKEEVDVIKSYEKCIIYGAGTVGLEVIQLLESLNINIYAIAVSDRDNNANQVGKYMVYQIEELLSMKENALVIIAVVNQKRQVIYDKLLNLGFKNIFKIDTEHLNLL